MDYRNVYFSRINHLGETTAQRIRNGGIRSFDKWMAESPHTVRNLSVERGIYFDGIILRSKDKEYEKIMFLNVSNITPLQVGDIMTWIIDDGSEEKWILVQEEKKTNGTYRSFWIIRCNYLLKWIDSNGHLQQSWSYVVSSVDSKIKGNYRTWNSLITPQPNKYAEILMPRYPIDRATNFIVEEESWTVIEYDHTSVPGTIYLSLTENKINTIYDDLVNNIADTDKLAHYNLSVPAETQQFTINNSIHPQFTIIKDGIPIKIDTILLPVDKTMVKNIGGELIGVKSGQTQLMVQLKDFPEIFQTINIELTDNITVFSAYIEGPDKIRLDRQATYKLIGTDEINGTVIFNLTDFDGNITSLATIIVEDNNCIVHANNKNKLTEINKPLILTATYNGVDYTKEISIIPLW